MARYKTSSPGCKRDVSDAPRRRHDAPGQTIGRFDTVWNRSERPTNDTEISPRECAVGRGFFEWGEKNPDNCGRKKTRRQWCYYRTKPNRLKKRRWPPCDRDRCRSGTGLAAKVAYLFIVIIVVRTVDVETVSANVVWATAGDRSWCGATIAFGDEERI